MPKLDAQQSNTNNLLGPCLHVADAFADDRQPANSVQM